MLNKLLVIGYWLLVILVLLPTMNHELITVYGQNPEENAIYNECAATTPKELCPEKVDTPQIEQNPLLQILNTLKTNLGGLIGLVSPNIDNPTKYYVQSQTTHQARIPTNLPESSQSGDNVLGVAEDAANNLKGFLGGSDGFFGATLPKLGSLGNEVKDYECLYQKASYPKGVAPVTGKDC
jgi:hypothetical protein